MTTAYLRRGSGTAGGGSSFTAGGDLTGTSSSQQVVSLTGTAGVVTGPSTALTLGSGNLPTSGLIRFSSGIANLLVHRNVANNVDQTCMWQTSDANLYVGDQTNWASVNLIGGVTNLYSGGTIAAKFGFANTDYVALGGTTVAAAGAFRLANATTPIMAERNAANTADIVYLDANTTDLFVGGSSVSNKRVTNLGLQCTAAFTLAAGGTNMMQLNSNGGDFINLGGTGGTVGFIRVSNNANIITARNAANSANIIALATTSSDGLTIGDNTVTTSWSIINAGGSGVLRAAQVNVQNAAGTQSQVIFTPSARTITLDSLGAHSMLIQTATSDVATFDLTVSAQAPFASAVTNITPGNLVLKIPATISGTGYGKVSVNVSGTEMMSFGKLVADGNALINAPTALLIQTATTSGNYFQVNTRNMFLTATSGISLYGGGNLSLFAQTGSFGGGSLVTFVTNAATDPTTNPTGGGILYASGGALKWRGSSGTVTTIAVA